MAISDVEQRAREYRKSLLLEGLQQTLAPGVTVENAVRLLDMPVERLAVHIASLTEQDESPWLKEHVLQLAPTWQDPDVGLAIVDKMELDKRLAMGWRHSNSIGRITYRAPREFDLEGEREIPPDVSSRGKIQNAVFTLARGIAQVAGLDQPFSDIDFNLLTGCSRDLMLSVPRYMVEEEYAREEPGEVSRLFRLQNISTRAARVYTARPA